MSEPVRQRMLPEHHDLPAPPPPEKLKLPRWREVFAIFGIAAGFFFFFTIPGWFGVGAWRRYRRGEPSTIKGWSIWGMIVVVLFVVVGTIAAFTTSESENPRPGSVDTRETLTRTQRLDRGGEIVGDVCYLP